MAGLVRGLLGKAARAVRSGGSARARAGSSPSAAEPTPDRIVLAYEPDADGDADPGEVVWGWVPFEDDPSQGKDRPVVIVGRWGRDLAGVPLSTKDHHGDPDRLPVGTGAWDRDRRLSYACVDRVLRFGPDDIRREGCALEPARFRELVDALTARAEPRRR